MQALVRRAIADGLFYKYENAKKNPDGHYIIHLIINLALLPADRVWEGVEEVYATINRLYRHDKVNRNKWLNFMNYFNRQWLKKITPEGFSTFGQIDRTNNYSESHNSVINFEVPKKPPCHKFIGKFEVKNL